MADFVHLHVHSDYSLQDAAVSVMQLADRAEELGMTHLALTDHGSMFGIMDFIAACQETIVEKEDDKEEHVPRQKPIHPIIGCEVYVSPGSRFLKKGTEKDNKYFHLVLLAASREGYFNLVKLCSFAYTEGFYYRPRIDEELLVKYHGGLIALSACVSGEIPRLIRAGKSEEAEKKALHYRDIFGSDAQGNPNFYLELQDHGIPADVLKCPYSQKDINREIIAISRKTGIPLVATNDVHYLGRDDYIAHDILLCIGTAKFRTDINRKKYFGDQFYLKTADEMAALFSDCPEAVTNTVKIAARCDADIPKITTKDLPRYLPDAEIPAGFSDTDSYLRQLASEGLAKRYPLEKEEKGDKWNVIQKRFEYELDTIIKMGFTGYFLIVLDFINWAREHDISVGPGRGSGAGSIVAYALRITNIDPLKYNLLFERFLNPERISMPDFDIDFANEGRDSVIKYVSEKYGNERVGQIITFGTLGAKAVIKDVARTLGISIDDSDRIAKLIPFRPGIKLKKAFKEEPGLAEMENDSRFTELFALARKLEGLNRHSSLHASGVVIGKTDLYNLVPVYKDTKTGAIATQFDMSHLEKCGLVKMDFLGLKTLDVIKHTENLIHMRGGEYADYNVENAPEDDEKTFKMLSEGQSFEVFQFESEGMRDVLRRAKPDKIEDLIALNALYRPGPMANIPRFIASKNGTQRITYPDPSLEDSLKETYGVIVYQEQVMRVAQIIAGFSLSHADELRRAMGKKNLEKMVKEKERFLSGAVERGYSENKADDIFEMLIPFADYGFNKSHAAGYAVLAYRTAYLKANFPAEFMAANLTNEIYSADKNKLSECIAEARRMKIKIDPPDVNRSEKLFSIVNGRIVYGLLGIKGLGDAVAAEIVRFRGDGPYLDFMDFLNRIDIKIVGKAVIEKLIQTGAFDRMGKPVSRENLLGNLERAVEFVQNQKEEKLYGQSSLFGESGEKEYADFIFENFPEISRSEKLKMEKQLIGFFLSGHPMDDYRKIWEKAVQVDLGQLAQGQGKKPEPVIYILVGIVQSVKIVIAKSGKMAYVTLADYNGEIEIIFFPKVWEVCQDKIREDEIAILRGRIDLQKFRAKYSFIAEEWVDIKEAEEVIKAEAALNKKREKFRQVWLYMANLKSGSLAKSQKGNYLAVGQLTYLKETLDKNKDDMAFGILSDFEGEIDLVFFSKMWEANRHFITRNEFFAFKGSFDPETDRNPERPSLKVNSLADITTLSRSAARKADAGEKPHFPSLEMQAAAAAAQPAKLPEIHICLDGEMLGNEQIILPVSNYLSGNAGPCPVFIHISDNGEKIIRAETGIGFDVMEEAVGILGSCTGVNKVWIVS